ncbi:MAG TPA: hypothetical protein VHA82_12345 [Ramlibacter sp.]|uniref:hypothetical protein n=1 Tax=Ramlibacter sp. TaxID=1917967 RepID=UPI002C817047|nr:hypothetical protein [Ramlibacter sp.]HVZ44591.1 hypothetical protein [Ramlibacter sp.]
MRKTSAQDITDFFYQYDEHITHIAVAHTTVRAYNMDARQMERTLEQLQQACHLFRRRFSQRLYGMKALRKPDQYGPLMLTTIEGGCGQDPRMTIHYNFALGNIPSQLTTDKLRQVFAECWSKQEMLTTDRLFLVERNQAETGWLRYITKEAHSGNLGTWDVRNTQIPHSALEAD